MWKSLYTGSLDIVSTSVIKALQYSKYMVIFFTLSFSLEYCNLWEKVSDWQLWKSLCMSTKKKKKKCASQGARIKASTAMFLSSDLKGLPSAHYSPWLVTWVPISTCNNDFSDMDASLLETGSTKLISSSPSKSHQKVYNLTQS